MTRLVLSLLILFPAAALLRAADEKPATKPEDPALRKQLEAIDAGATKIKDFTARFRQEKFTALLKKPLVSRGVVRVSGTIIRWDTKEPEPAVLLSDGREVRMYYPNQKLLEIYSVDQRIGDLAASPLPRLSTLHEHFTFDRSQTKTFKPAKGRKVLPLRLMPLDESLRKHVEEVHVLLDVEAAHILELEIIGIDADRTHVTFSEIRLNTGVQPADLELTVPEGTTVSRPLEVKDDR